MFLLSFKDISNQKIWINSKESSLWLHNYLHFKSEKITATNLYTFYVCLLQKTAFLLYRKDLFVVWNENWIKLMQVSNARGHLIGIIYYLCLVYLCLLFLEIILFIKFSAGFSVQEQLATGGVLWFLDLTSLDSTWILPISIGVINLLIVEVSGFKWDVLPFKSLGFCCCYSDIKYKCDWVGGDSSELE